MMFNPYMLQDKSVSADVDELFHDISQLFGKVVELKTRVTRAEIDRESIMKELRELRAKVAVEDNANA